MPETSTRWRRPPLARATPGPQPISGRTLLFLDRSWQILHRISNIKCQFGIDLNGIHYLSNGDDSNPCFKASECSKCKEGTADTGVEPSLP